ncbi:MAG TPA: HAD family phosphatase [Acidimicrobiia bacterium]|nr:HAD family phosphatase [Acidimicrobiia bacterium]
MTVQRVTTVVFDIGGVLVDWNPRHLFDQLIADPDEREWFVTNVVSAEWNHAMDAGRAVDESIATLSDRFPEQRYLIEAWWTRWPEMLGGEVPGTRAIAETLKDSGMPLYALTNWSAETWPHGVGKFPFLGELFEGIVVSGREGVAKPDPRIFRILIDRFDLDPGTSLYIDDLPANVAVAAEMGFVAHRFTSAADLGRALESVTR